MELISKLEIGSFKTNLSDFHQVFYIGLHGVSVYNPN